MNKSQFVTEIKGLLGEESDPLEIKRKLEEGDRETPGLGQMSYEETAIFIKGYRQASEAIEGLRDFTAKDEVTRETSADTPLAVGVNVSRHKSSKRGGYHRPTEEAIIGKEREI